MSGGSRSGPPLGTWVKGFALLAFLATMAAVAVWVDLPELGEVREIIESWGFWGFAGFVLAYALIGITPIPVTVLSLVAGVVFGFVGGAVLSTVGATLGAIGGYGLARVLGEDVVMRLLGKHATTVRTYLGDGGYDAVFALRVMPGVPYWPANYGAGALGVKLSTFSLAALLSTIPSQLSLVAVGSFIVERTWPVGVVVVLACGVQLFLALRALREWKEDVEEEKEDQEEQDEKEDQEEKDEQEGSDKESPHTSGD